VKERFEPQSLESFHPVTQESHQLASCNNPHTIQESFEIVEITITRDHELEKLKFMNCTPPKDRGRASKIEAE
jgi:hypothetical protein